MTRDGYVVLTVIIAVIVLGTLIAVVSRRSHIRSWRFGVFYESEDRWKQENKEEGKDGTDNPG